MKYLVECRYEPACNLKSGEVPHRLGLCDQGCGNPAVGELTVQFDTNVSPDPITQRCALHMLDAIESYEDLAVAMDSTALAGHLKLGMPWRWVRPAKEDVEPERIFVYRSFVLEGDIAARVSTCFRDVDRIIKEEHPKQFKDETGRLFTGHFVSIEPSDDAVRRCVIRELQNLAESEYRAKRLRTSLLRFCAMVLGKYT